LVLSIPSRGFLFGTARLGEREIPGDLQATTDLNGGGRPDSLIIGLAPGRSLTND
jgi:hypothetical protein